MIQNPSPNAMCGLRIVLRYVGANIPKIRQ